MPYTEADYTLIAALSTTHDASKPIYMLNMLRYRPEATYTPARPDLPAASGRDVYFSRYVAALAPFFAAAGSAPTLVGKAYAPLVGPPGEAWDDVAVVMYPSVKAFREMVESERYAKECAPHRRAALEDWRLVPLEQVEM